MSKERDVVLLCKLKSYFSERFLSSSDLTSGGCDTCGYGGKEGMSLSAINGELDSFVKHELFKKHQKGE